MSVLFGFRALLKNEVSLVFECPGVGPKSIPKATHITMRIIPFRISQHAVSAQPWAIHFSFSNENFSKSHLLEEVALPLTK